MDASMGKKKKTRKRSAPQSDEDPPSAIMVTDTELAMHEPDGQYDVNEPTMGEKLADLTLLGDAEPPSADSMYLLLKQALRAEDHALLLNCLYTRDEQLIDSRVSTFGSALRLSACLDNVFAGVPDLDDGEEEEEVKPVIFEDRDSEEEGTAESDDDEEDEEDLGAVIDFPHGSNRGDAVLDSGDDDDDDDGDI
ncbi:unnamed protein product [Spirodela intermedia]|uniref:Uncharacterized protein n=1 Tax=Spirodela intermedia TaxID=51605 RepID=A0A7I8J8F1_SPIIN|nr:unnamed protein product [Spirodela intermedia]CAA6666369.1 unnamed protein product [Spirodela intermedia]